MLHRLMRTRLDRRETKDKIEGRTLVNPNKTVRTFNAIRKIAVPESKRNWGIQMITMSCASGRRIGQRRRNKCQREMMALPPA